MNENNKIKDVEQHVTPDALAFLHQTISSPRGDYFRRRVLQKLRDEASVSDIKKMRTEAGLRESQRHINKLLELKLIEKSNEATYRRTDRGEKAVNALRALETELGKEEARKIFKSFFGANSIRFFLRVYGAKKEVGLPKKEIKFTAREIGKLGLFLPRSIEGIAVIDKLSDAGILTYKGNGHVHLMPKKARAFYKYLQSLYKILTETR